MTINSPTYCCVWLKNAVAKVGDKGFGVMAVTGERRIFYLEAKPFDRAIDLKYAARNGSGQHGWPLLTDHEGVEVPYMTSVILPLRFCPACGTDLRWVIEANPAGFDALAAQQLEQNPEFGRYGM